jgi:hypothetical protein
MAITHFYDDFRILDPAFGEGSAQEALQAVMVSSGLPLSAEKHVPMSERFTFFLFGRGM